MGLWGVPGSPLSPDPLSFKPHLQYNMGISTTGFGRSPDPSLWLGQSSWRFLYPKSSNSIFAELERPSSQQLRDFKELMIMEIGSMQGQETSGLWTVRLAAAPALHRSPCNGCIDLSADWT
jgi:hypothetical protein